MRRSKVELYVHMVWATARREPLLSSEITGPVQRCVQQEAQRLHADVLAPGGMADHVHLLAKIPATISVADYAKQLKGVSSHFVHQQLHDMAHFQWQEGYGAFTISRSHVARVKAYIANQARHHSADAVWPEWEEVDEETPESEAV